MKRTDKSAEEGDRAAASAQRGNQKRRRTDDSRQSLHQQAEVDRDTGSPHLGLMGLSSSWEVSQAQQAPLQQQRVPQNAFPHAISNQQAGSMFGLQGQLPGIQQGSILPSHAALVASAAPLPSSLGTDPALTYQRVLLQQLLSARVSSANTLVLSGIANSQYPGLAGDVGAVTTRNTALSDPSALGGTALGVRSFDVAGVPAQPLAQLPASIEPTDRAGPTAQQGLTSPPQVAERLGQTGHRSIMLYLPCDEQALSPYQCLVRKQIEVFEAGRLDVESSAQGRNKPIVLGQVGIRCKHCAFLIPKSRARGAVYYPTKLEGLYQAAQNMASSHLCQDCQHVPEQIRQELLKLRERKSSKGGGKKYWADGVRALGVHEADDGCLRFVQR